MSTWRLTTLKKKKYSCVAKNKSFGIAGTRSFQGSHLPFFCLFLGHQSLCETQTDGKHQHADLSWTLPDLCKFLSSSSSEVRLMETQIFLGRSRSLGIVSDLGSEWEMNVRIYPGRLQPMETLSPWTHTEIEVAVTNWTMFPPNPYVDALSPSTSECDYTLETEYLKS